MKGQSDEFSGRRPIERIVGLLESATTLRPTPFMKKKVRLYCKRLTLEDLKDKTDEQIRAHWVSEWEIKPEEAERYNPIASYESVGDYGCDSSAWFLIQDRETGALLEVHGSHCSCYGFEGQFTPEPTTLEYLKSNKFGLSCGGYDRTEAGNEAAVVEFLKTL